jgi:4-hydroxythreonine-4-phosphate dehydrogenase
MGDASGIGPEITVKALLNPRIAEICRPLVVGDGDVLLQTINSLETSLALNHVDSVPDIFDRSGTVNILDLDNLEQDDVVTGKVCRACGKAAMEYIEKAAGLIMKKKAAALVTAPINKEATIQAGYGDVGHLEYLARITGVKEYATMLVSGSLRVVHLTTHYSLKEACKLVTRGKIMGRLRLTHDAFRKWGIARPRLGVAALNPHGSEGGLFGSEEMDEILPAVQEARTKGIDARGPYPADSIFTRALNGEFDAVLAMYHDQGHIAVKVHGFERSISIALGLPFIRTSVDHGTAFDIAGKGIADSRSLEEAIKAAVSLTRGKLQT